MKKLLLTSLYFLPSVVKANPLLTFPTNIPRNSLDELITKVSTAIISISATIAVWFLIVGAFQYVTSAGNPISIDKAKSTIFYAIIGLIVVILSYMVVNFVINAF